MATVEATESKLDSVKLALAVLVLAAGVYGFYHFEQQFLLIYRVLALLGVVLVSLLIVYQTAKGKSIWQYAQDSRTELRKVVWPTRTETLQTTLIVAVIVIIVGLALWLLDIFFGWFIQWLLSL